MMKLIKKHKGFIGWALFIAIVSFSVGVFQKHYLPQIKVWALTEITKFTDAKTPIKISAESLEFDLFPIGATLNNVYVEPKQDLAKTITPLKITSVSAHISFWSFLTGKLELSRIHIHKFDIKAFLQLTRNKNSKNEGFDFSILSQIPVQRLLVTEAKVWLQDKNSGVSAHAPAVNFEILNRKIAALSTLDAKNFQIKKTGDEAIFDSDISFRVRADNNKVILNRLRIKKEDSFILASGSMDWNSNKLEVYKIKGKTRSLIQMKDVEFLGKEFFPEQNIPHLDGRVFMELSTDHEIGKSLVGNARVRSRALEIDEYYLGDIKAKATVDKETAKFNQLEFAHPAGQANLDNLVIELKPPYPMKSKVTGKGIDLYPLLTAVTIDDIGIYSSINPNFDCAGQLDQPLRIVCNGTASAESIDFYTDPNKKSEIIKIQNITAKARAVIGPKSLFYTASASMPNSTAISSGNIAYDKTIKIDVESKKLSFKDVKTISKLEFGGDVLGKGVITRKGDDIKAQFSLESKDFSFEKWRLDQINTDFFYDNKILTFSNIIGEVLNSKYEGQVNIDLIKDNFSVDANIPQLDFSGINLIVPENIPLPRLESAGLARALFRMSGPFDLLKTDWTANLNTQRGVIAGESFDKAVIALQSEAGKLSSRQCLVQKGNGRLNCQVKGTIGGDAEVTVDAKRMSLEQSETAQNYVANLSGFADFQLKVSNFTKDLHIQSSGELKSLLLGDLPLDNIDYQFTQNDNLLSGNFKLGQDIINTEFTSDLKNNYSLKGIFNNWDFSRFFSAFSDSLRVNTYEANLRGNFDFKGSLKDTNNVDGNFLIENLSLRSNNIKIENSQPMEIAINNGNIQPKNFLLEGMDNSIRLRRSNSKSPVGLIAEGRLEMTLLSLLTPFFDDLKGLMNFSLDLRGKLNQLKFSGNTYIQNGFVKLKEFPHPIEQYSADILFDNNKVVINSVRGRMAGGAISANGQVTFKGYKNIPVDVQGSFLDSSFEVPAGFFTRGSGDFSVNGQWLPYRLGINYNITEGRVQSEIDGSIEEKSEVQPSPLLPPSALENRFTPVVLDLNLDLPQNMPVNMLVARLDIRANIDGSLRAQGPPTTPLLNGRVNVGRGSQVIFRDNTFDILSGYLQYNKTAPSNPNLNVTAFSTVVAKVGANEEREIDITLRVVGPALNPEVNVSSQPALSERDLISLLAFGFVPTTNQNTDSTNPSYQLGNVVVNELFGLNKTIRKNFGVEVDYSSGFDAENDSDTHTVTVKKQWTPKFGASVSRSFGKTNKNQVRAEYKINNKWSVIGSYEGEEQSGSQDVSNAEDDEESQFGVDLEYKVDFK